MRNHFISIRTLALFIFIFETTNVFSFESNRTGVDLITLGDSINREIPKCPFPANVTYSWINYTTAKIFWDDYAAQKEILEYEIRYKNEGTGNWKKLTATIGSELLISGLDQNFKYVFEIRKICFVEGSNKFSESEWVKVWPIQLRTPSNNQCDSLGNIEVNGLSGTNISFSIEQSYINNIEQQGCNIVFLTNWCDPGGPCYPVYWVYNDTNYINFESDLDRLYNPASGNFLEAVSAFIVCPENQSLQPGAVFSDSEWDNFGFDLICPDTLLYTAPDVINFNCGENFTIPATSFGNLQSASIGDTFTIGGYPIVLTSVSGSNGVFSGSGNIRLPLQGIVINVPFVSLSVNTRKQVIGGSISIQSDPLFDPEELPVWYVQGQMCIPPAPPETWDSLGVNSVTGLPWDVYGFGSDSTYTKIPPYPGWEEGDPYDPNFDPNGFNNEGIHILTNSPFNEYGCSRDGLDTLGQPCNPMGPGPYYWLNQSSLGPETEVGIAFKNEIEDTIILLIIQVLEEMQNKINDSISVQESKCDDIRSDMNDLLLILGYDPDYIYGPSQEYFEEGMHENFQSKPKPFQVAMDRDNNTILLENKHISLYECDYTLGVFKNILSILSDYLEQTGQEELKGILLEKIKHFTTEDVATYSNINSLLVWIENELLLIINDNYKDTYGEIIGLNTDQSYNFYDFERENMEELSSYVSLNFHMNETDGFHPGRQFDNDSYSTISQFVNGNIWINGTHRALILEQMIESYISADEMLTNSILPIQVSLEVMGIVYTIMVDRITFTTTGANLDAYMVITDPQSGRKIVFQGLAIAFNPNGIISGSELSLASEVEIRLSNSAKLIVHESAGTFVTIDCNGFAGMGVDASVEFCREFLIPVDTNTMEVIADEEVKVQAHFQAEIPSWNDFLAEISIDPFAITNSEQVKFIASNAIVDFSDTRNFEMEFPSIYNSPHVHNGIAFESWKGFYLGELSASFDLGEDPNQVSIGVQNFIIDDRGVTGELFAAGKILELEEGNLFGWPFSIDTLQVVFIANNLYEGGIRGHINIPIFESSKDPDPDLTVEDCFAYSAQMTTTGGFNFIVSTENEYLTAPLFKAGEITLAPNSGIIISTSDTGFVAKATLNGSLSINASLTNSIDVNFTRIDFTGFEVSNMAPYFSPGIWSLPGSLGINIGGFSASIRDIKLLRGDEEDEVAMSVILKLGLAEGDLDIWAEGRTQIIGNLEVIDGRQKWVYDRFKIDQIFIDADIKGNKVRGGLIFYEDDPLYNKGFRGIIGLDLSALKVSVMAVAQFGKHEDGFKYFFVDALANIEGGIGTGSFKLLGLGGGLYYHMSRDISSVAPIPSFPTGLPSLGNLGEGLSDIIYIPNDSVSIGFKATIVFATTLENAFNGNASFEMVFNTGGGIREIRIEGNARFMSEVDFGGSPTFSDNANSPPLSVPLSAYVSIKYDFNNKILDGDLNVFLNTSTFSGAGSNGQLVWAKLYFSPTAWYINIGTPSNPCGVILNIPGIGQLVQATAYLDIGTNIEPMPPLPQNVASLTGTIRSHPMRGTGKGFAFGAAIHLSTGEIKFLILRASLEAAIGFDVLVQDYGEATCYHSGNKPGIDGWYASGQVYAFLEGKVGVKAFGKVHPILELGLAAALQARLPNPVWLHGAFGVRYKLLGGIIKGNHRFRFTIGQLCELVHPDGDSSVLEQEIIQDITPPYRSNGVNSDTEISVFFNYGIDQIVTDLEETNSYRIKIRKAELLWRNNVIPGTNTIEDGGYVLVFKPSYYLPELDTIHFRVTVDVFQNNNLVQTESDSIWFVTGTRPQNIPTSNIVASYPINGQYNFYPKEYQAQNGYIILDIGQPYLFIENKPEIWLINSNGSTHILSYQYDFLGKKISFQLPEEILENGAVYKLAMVKSKNSESIKEPEVNLPGLKSSEPELETYALPVAQDILLAHQDVLIQLVFRVSIFDDFRSKLNAISSNYSALYSNKKVLTINPTVAESWGYHEVPNAGYEPMVSVLADLNKLSWYNTEIYPFLYKLWPGNEYSNYPLSLAYSQVPYLNRVNLELDIPPRNACYIPFPTIQESFITNEMFLKGSIPPGQMQKLFGNYHSQILADWNDVKQQLQNYYLVNINDYTGPNPDPFAVEADKILNHPFPLYGGNQHFLRWEYRLPGTNQLTSSIPMTIQATNQSP